MLKVRACGVCRCRLHIVDEELPPHRDAVVPGHQIVGDVVAVGTEGVTDRAIGERVGDHLGRRGGRNVRTVPRGARKISATLQPIPGTIAMGATKNMRARAPTFTFALPRELDDLA